MPGMNGWEFRAAQLRDPEIAPIPVVVMTADGHAPEKASSIGAQDYLRKPVDLDELVGKVSHFFR
jgi:two-component system, chemotaxis family, chemotaxis protein CheY